MKIVHIADIHLKLNKHHKQFRVIFEDFYEKIKNIRPDYVFVVGDLFHNKINVSNESIILATEFLNNVANIAKTFVILGNHDCNVKSLDRLDSISPIINALKHPNLCFEKYTKQINLRDNVTLNILSIFDKNKWKEIVLEKENINIALGHFAVKNCVTETGWIIDKGEIDVTELEKYDFVMLGDIHTIQSIGNNGNIRYCGSFLQQNFSETKEKGFLLWDIEKKDSFKCDFVSLYNPNLFITLEIDETGKIVETEEIPENSRIRLVSNCNLSYDVVNRAKEIVNIKYKPESVVFLNRGITERNISDEHFEGDIQEDLRDIEVQERLIKDYLKDYEVSEKILNNVFELNRKYKTIIDNEEDVKRNVRWKLKSIEWDNLFNFGENNKIEYKNIRGVVGSLGKSFSGKTSAICDSLSYIMFDSITKNERKSFNIINQNKETAKGKVTVELDNKTYCIERSCEKYKKVLKGQITDEARVSVDFYSLDKEGQKENLNGAERDETNKNIRRIFGTIDDFLLTNLSSQFGFLNFINEGSTRRKEILAKYLDLDIFDKKYKMAKEDSVGIKAALKRLENRNYGKELSNVEKEIKNNRNGLKEQREKCDILKEEEKNILIEIEVLRKTLDNIPTDIVDYKKIKEEKESNDKKLESVQNEIKKKEDAIKQREESKEKIENFLSKEFDIEKQRKQRDEALHLISLLREKENLLKHKKDTLEINRKKTLLLKDVPCGDSFKHCKFIKDAYDSKNVMVEIEKEIEMLQNVVEGVKKEIEEKDIKKIEDYIKKYDMLVEKKNKIVSELGILRDEIYNKQNHSQKLAENANFLNQKVEEYNKNKEIIENAESTVKQKKEKEEYLKSLENKLQDCEKQILMRYKTHGMLEQKQEELSRYKNELETLRDEYAAYELFEKCFGFNGISYQIIKRKLPYINGEIAKILSNVAPFSVYLKENGNKLDITIKHPKYEERVLQMASGAEKTIAALAIRCALMKIGTLPISNFLILDEPVTAFDGQLLENFSTMLDTIKENFDFIIIISHLEQLKDIVDSEIIIEKDEKGYARVNQ